MTAWIVVGVLVAVLAAAVVWTLRTEPATGPSGDPESDAAGEQTRVPLRAFPDPDEVHGVVLPTAWRGYDPVVTEVVLARLGRAYAALWEAADEDVRRQAAARVRDDRDRGRATPPGARGAR